MLLLLFILLPNYHKILNDLGGIKLKSDANNKKILSKYKKKSEINYHIYDVTSGNDIPLNIKSHISNSNSMIFPSSNPEFCILLNKVQNVNKIIISKVLRNKNFVQDYLIDVSIIDGRGEISVLYSGDITGQEDNVIETKNNQQNIKGFMFKLKSKSKNLNPVEVGKIRLY